MESYALAARPNGAGPLRVLLTVRLPILLPAVHRGVDPASDSMPIGPKSGS